MAVEQDLLGYSLLLVAACVFGFVSEALNEHIWALVAFVLFMATGGLGAAVAMHFNEDLTKFYNHAFFVSQTAGVDLIMTDICILSGVEKNLALLNLIPPAVDTVMKYFVDSNWKLVTPITHIVSLGLMCFFGYRDHRYVLFISAIGFLCAIARLMNKSEGITVTHVFNAVGVFFVGWSLAGKDLEDLGIPV